ncbi:MAG: TonB family protein, partial [Roseicyclus sp.]
ARETRPQPQRQAARAPQGNGRETTRAGDTQGAAEGTATRTQQGAGGQSASDGRAAAQYPQLVNRHLSRLRRPNARFDGMAVVAFTIAANGGLASLSVARSSGNAEFDRLALAHVQRAAPFPPPPGGAQRSYNVTVRGR